jgi:mono/diheme cytochrome c family protein
MRALLSISAVAIVILGVSGGAGGQNLPPRGDPQAGQRIAGRACDACHIVVAHQELTPLVPNAAPSFFAIADRPGTTQQSLAAFLAHAHPYGRMPYPELTPAQIADISAYILSLRHRR